MMIDRTVRHLLVAAACLAGSASHALLVNPNNPTGDTFTNAGPSNQGQAVGASGWYYNNVRNGGIVGIDGTYARSGNGSAFLQGTQGPAAPSSKVDIEFLGGGANVNGNFVATSVLGLFRDFTVMQYDWLRDSSSTNNAVQHPAMRILLDLDGNLQTTTDRGGLVFERAYNGGGAVPVDTWTTEVIGASSRLWNFGLGLGTEFDIDNDGTPYDTLAEWQASGRLTGAAIIGFSVGIGSGWGAFTGAVDNVGWTIGDASSSFNFELAAGGTVPAPGGVPLVGLGLACAWGLRRLRRA